MPGAALLALILTLIAQPIRAGLPVLWSSQWQGLEPPILVKSVPGDGAYVAGTKTLVLTDPELALRRYDASGAIAWTRGYIGPVPGYDALKDLAIDTAGSAVVAGRTGSNGAAYSIAVVKYAPDGTRQWDRVITRPNPCGWGMFADAMSLAVDAGGNILLASNMNCSFLLIKLDPDGNTLWTRSYSTGAQLGDAATDILSDTNDDVIVVGTTNGGAGPYATVKYDTNGNLLWDRLQPGQMTTVLGPAYVAVGPGNVIVVAASPETPCGLPQEMIWSYQADGTPRWDRKYGGDCDGGTTVGLALDGAGNAAVFATHHFQYRVIKYDPAGNVAWSRSYAGTDSAMNSEAGAGAVGPGDMIVVTGGASAPSLERDFTTIACAPGGAQAWLESFGASSSSSKGTSIDCDGSRIYVSGARWDDQAGPVAATVCYQYQPLTGVRQPGVHLALEQNRPNPFNPATRISYQLAQPGHVRVEIFDTMGRLVRTLVDEMLDAGPHETGWDGRDALGRMQASGVYLCRLAAGDLTQSRKMLLLK